jgi:hypothetical protein
MIRPASVLSAAALLCACGAPPPAAGPEWTPLFNGKDLEGWAPKGGAKWTVEDGCLVGQQDNGKPGDLYTTKDWDNFELRFAYKVVWPANSGVWFRGKYQYDILKYKNPVAYSGSLYCPGKMFILKNLDEALERRDGWNEGQVYANGDRLIQWLNGKQIGECRDATVARGPFGLQVHGGDEFKAMKILVKRVEVRLLKADEEPTPPAATK